MNNISRVVFTLATLAAASAAWGRPPISVPEPGSMALLAVGVAGAVAALRSRRK